ncbi:MAG: helix-turn-helix transcriptional regulator [Clostridia bacterium]
MNSKLIGKRIQSARENAGLSQEQLAENADISHTFMTKIECGNRTPSLETLVKICNALNVSADTLLMDVLDKGYEIKASMLSSLMQNATKREQQIILDLIEVVLKNKED